MFIMYDGNICVFVPHSEKTEQLHVVNYVYETKFLEISPISVKPYFRVHCVVNGCGRLHLPGKVIEISEGNVFITLPNIPYSIESVENFEVSYVSFIGGRANMLMDKCKISADNCVFPDLPDMNVLWKRASGMTSDVTALYGEGILLCTISAVFKRLSVEAENIKSETAAVKLRRFLDENFSDPEMGLDKLSSNVGLNPKYISSLFKKTYGIGVSEYLNTLRIRHACVLIEQGISGVKDISNLCGFSDPMYFSRLFKAKLGVSPREYVRTHNLYDVE